jgi:hypothetical protein
MTILLKIRLLLWNLTTLQATDFPRLPVFLQDYFRVTSLEIGHLATVFPRADFVQHVKKILTYDVPGEQTRMEAGGCLVEPCPERSRWS